MDPFLWKTVSHEIWYSKTNLILLMKNLCRRFKNYSILFLQSSREPILYVLDCLFSVVVVGSLVVFVWRGVWDLLDIYLFPQDLALSAWASFVRFFLYIMN